MQRFIEPVVPEMADFDDIPAFEDGVEVADTPLSKRDLSIFLARALNERRLLGRLDLLNCGDEDLLQLRDMVRDQIDIRLAGDSVSLGYPNYIFSSGVDGRISELLASQLNVADKEATSAQVDILAGILRQLGGEFETRGGCYEVVDAVRGRIDLDRFGFQRFG